jgi:glucose-6-phosphate dehydrogenase assembly protein OpcA
MKALGQPVKADVAVIEKELASLSKLTVEAGAPRHVLRACACSLISILQNRDRAVEFLPALARVSESHPNRSLIAFAENAPAGTQAEEKVRAWIHTQCSTRFSGQPQVCCEVILAAAQPKDFAELSNFLSALVREDLPVYVYWRSLKTEDEELLKRLARHADLLIVDSHRSRENPERRFRLLQLLMDPFDGISIRDLNWARLTPWRDLLSQFFDPPAARRYLREISEVDITRNISNPGSIPTRTLLLTGWLASRMGWRQASASRSGDRWISRWTADQGEIRVTFTGTAAQEGQIPGIHSIALRTQSNATFSVSMEQGASCITAAASAADFELTHSVPYEDRDEASLLIEELTHTSEDTVFKAALKCALQLEQSFQAGA